MENISDKESHSEEYLGQIDGKGKIYISKVYRMLCSDSKTDDFELGEKWINDPKKWYEVYTVKPYEYMAIIAEGKVPVFSKEANKYVSKDELDKMKAEAEAEKMSEAASASKDYSEITNENTGSTIIDGSKFDTSDDEDGLPF